MRRKQPSYDATKMGDTATSEYIYSCRKCGKQYLALSTIESNT